MTTMSKPILIDTHTEFCYQCKCGCTHWVEEQWLKNGYTLQCYCGISYKLRVSPKQARSDTKPDNIKETKKKLKTILRAQGFSTVEINTMLDGVVIGGESVGQLLKTLLCKATE